MDMADTWADRLECAFSLSLRTWVGETPVQ